LKEIVQRILETEKEARESIERARADAQKIVREAEDRSGQVEEGVRERAVHEAQAIIERMKQEAEEERQRQLEKARGGSAEIIARKGTEIEAAALRVANLILGIEKRELSLF
jgi:F-type H+-transporting ATPase subunit b